MFKNRLNKILTENRPSSYINTYRNDYVAAPKGYKRVEPIRSATKSGNRRHNPHPRHDWYMPTMPIQQSSDSKQISSSTLNSIINEYRHQTTYRNDFNYQSKPGCPPKYSYLMEGKFGAQYGYLSQTQHDFQTPVLKSYHRGRSTKITTKVKGALPTILEHSPYSTVGTQSTQYNNDYNDTQTLQLPKLESTAIPMVAQAEETGVTSDSEEEVIIKPKHVHFERSSN